MKYCTQCGTPLHTDSPEQKVCVVCMETAASVGVEALRKNGGIDLKDWKSYVGFLQRLVRNPERGMQEAVSQQGWIPAVLTSGIASIVLSLIVLVYFRQLFALIGSFFGGGGLLWGSSLYVDIPYGSIFFRSLLLFLLQWVLLSLLLMGGAKLFKKEMSLSQALLLAGFAKFYFAMAAIAGMVAGFVSFDLGLGIFGGAFAFSILLLYQGSKTIIPNGTVYYVAASLCAYYIAQLLLVRIFL